jgi:acyl carrier protein
MTEAEILARVRAKLTEALQVDESHIELTSSLVDDLGADSLDLVALVMNLEEAFFITIPDEAAGKMRTVGDIVQFLAAHSAPAPDPFLRSS